MADQVDIIGINLLNKLITDNSLDKNSLTLEHLLKLCGTSLPPKQHKIFLI